MTHLEKIEELREILREGLLPLIDSDYVIFDLPYYYNYGDALIYKGEQRLLSEVPYKCLFKSRWCSDNAPKISPDVIVLLQGGGNFGDLYDFHPKVRREAIEKYPNNRVIVFPQTVHFEDEGNLKREAEFYAKYPNVTICARDKVSYDILCSNFSNKIMLLPDMAFMIDVAEYGCDNSTLAQVSQSSKTLFLRREDKELKSDYRPAAIPPDADVSDWPEPRDTASQKLYLFMAKVAFHIDKRVIPGFYHFYFDKVWQCWRMERNIKDAMAFVDQYDQIFTTRLHVMILGLLQGKQVHVIDNSYGKNSSFYDTWLDGVDNVSMFEQ